MVESIFYRFDFCLIENYLIITFNFPFAIRIFYVTQICLHRFKSGEVIVATECEHVFHKHCFQEWLRQARTCPVCRTDIPDSLNTQSEEDGSNQSVGSRNETSSGMQFPPGLVSGQERFQEVANIFGSLRQNESRQREQNNIR